MTNTARYNINYAKLIVQRIPQDLQFDEFIAWLNRFCDPFVFIYNLVVSYRTNTLYKLDITSQVFSLEKMLNDRYDTVARRIFIDDGQIFDPTYEYIKAEGRTHFVYKKSESHLPKEYDLLKGEVTGFSYNFVVWVPIAVTFNENEMKGLLDANKLAGKIYSIQTF